MFSVVPQATSAPKMQKKSTGVYKQHQNTTAPDRMPLAATTSALFYSEEFWGALTLDSLSMLMRTCKAFREDLQQPGARDSPPTAEQAMQVMIRCRPTANLEWLLTFEEAKYQFSLNGKTLVQFCMELPQEDITHITETDVGRWKSGYFTPYIRFLDAYSLAKKEKGGLKAAMERRNKLCTKVVKEGKKLLAKFEEPTWTMSINTSAAIKVLNKTLANIQKQTGENDAKKKKKTPDEVRVAGAIRVLKMLLESLHHARYCQSTIKQDIKNTRNIPRMQKFNSETKTVMKNIIERYRTHSAHCQEKMTLNFLTGLDQ